MMRIVSTMLCAVLLISLRLHAAPGAPRFVVDAEVGYLLGAVKNGRWVETKTARHWLRGGEKYTLYDGNRVAGTAQGGKPYSMETPCPETYLVKLKGATRGIAVPRAASRCRVAKRRCRVR